MNTQEEIKTTFNLSKELDYIAGDIATKNVVSNDNGSVTLLAFDKNAMIARHSVASDVLVYVLEGEVEFEVEDKRRTLERGDAILLPANTPHTVLALDKAKVVLTRIKA
ncbi:MAG: cupin domain-containing protein [Muribaculaceae bacterium]|nr:cupin domain-containing protein [Muribaculaceae bacterium]